MRLRTVAYVSKLRLMTVATFSIIIPICTRNSPISLFYLLNEFNTLCIHMLILLINDMLMKWYILHLKCSFWWNRLNIEMKIIVLDGVLRHWNHVQSLRFFLCSKICPNPLQKNLFFQPASKKENWNAQDMLYLHLHSTNVWCNWKKSVERIKDPKQIFTLFAFEV